MNLEEVFNNFTKKRILVLGDVMVDAYLRGEVKRVSPEAPVPIINLVQSEERLGGAANVALNLLALGATPILCGVVGDDRGGRIFLELMEERKLTSTGIIKSEHRRTTIKTRVIGNNQHLLRIDEEESDSISADLENAFIEKIKTLLDGTIDAIIIEDYNKGLLTPKLIKSVVDLANQNDVITAVDPKKENFFEYKGVTLFKPNLKELKEGLNVEFNLSSSRDKFEEAIVQLEAILENKISLVTLSEHGVFVKNGEAKNYFPAHIRNISDVSGAGDTVISVATLCLASGMNPKIVAEIANLSGGLVCEESGVVPINKDHLMKEAQKIISA